MSTTHSLRRLFTHVSRRRRWQLAGLVVLMLLGAVAEMATLGAIVPFLALISDPSVADRYPWLAELARWVGGREGDPLLGAAILFGIIAVAAGGVRMLLMWVSQRFSFGLGADLGGAVYLRTLHRPFSWHVARNSSQVLAGIDRVNAVISGTLNPILQGAVAAVMALGILVVLFRIDAQAALIAGVSMGLLYGATTVMLRQQLLRNGRVISTNVKHRVQAVQEGLGGIRDVLLDGTQHIFHRRFTAYDVAMRRRQAANNFIGAAPRYVIEAVGMTLIIALAYWLANRDKGFAGAIPVLGALAIGAQKLLPQVQIIYQSWSSYISSRAQLDDVLELLDHPVQPARHGRRQENFAAQAATLEAPLITLRDVSFRYKADAPLVLTGIDLAIPRGARIGIVGKTGSGKSTLVDLIMGLLGPSAGSIEFGGKQLSDTDLWRWQARIAHVPQAIFLSDATIEGNIAFGVAPKDVDLKRVHQSAATAQLQEFIDSLPQQYDTVVGERGVRLSGGQRQRIGLARAFYKKADVLVLDEATSALDDATERAVMEAITGLGRELTVLMIAHRVTTLRDCDTIVELAEGRVRRIGDYASIIGSGHAPQRAVTVA